MNNPVPKVAFFSPSRVSVSVDQLKLPITSGFGAGGHVRFRRYFAVGARVGEGPKTTQSGPGLVFMIPGRLRIEAIEKDRGIRLLIGRRPADPPDFDPGMTVPKFGDVLVPGSA